MSVRMQVRHVTGFTYEQPVTSSYNEARMTPLTLPGQIVLSSTLDVRPASWSYRYWDYWGCQVTAFELHEPHDELVLEAESTVQVDRRPPEPTGLGWGDLADPRLRERWSEFLTVTPRVAPEDDLTARVEELRSASTGPTDLAHAVCGLVHDEMDYVVASTAVHSTAGEAWRDRKGVCQDMAHVCLGALRAVGVPARYVSGYLHPSRHPERGTTVTGESHAWVEWWDGEWVGFDPTNQVTPDDRYVVVGAGRDYADVAPLSGIFSGGATSSMFVEVHITRTG